MWEPLRRDFVEMDPYRTGFVTREEFSDVLRELCVHLTDKEVELISDKFDTNTDGRFVREQFTFLRSFYNLIPILINIISCFLFIS